MFYNKTKSALATLKPARNLFIMNYLYKLVQVLGCIEAEFRVLGLNWRSPDLRGSV